MWRGFRKTGSGHADMMVAIANFTRDGVGLFAPVADLPLERGAYRVELGPDPAPVLLSGAR